MPKTMKNHNLKKSELVELSEALFIERGYEATSIEDILKASGLSKGGFYHYFKSKEEVLIESMRSFAEDMLQELEPIIEAEGVSALDKLNRFMEKKQELQSSKRDLAKYFIMLTQSDFTYYRYITTITEMYIKPFTAIIQQGVEEGIFTVEFPRETADILLRAITSVPQSIYYREYLDDKEAGMRYKASIEAIAARTLGIDKNTIKIF